MYSPHDTYVDKVIVQAILNVSLYSQPESAYHYCSGQRLHGNGPATRSAVSNAFDRTRYHQPRNGVAMSLFEQAPTRPPSLPCPRCGAPMWFSRLEPHPTQHDALDEVTFQCACGELLTKNEAR
jgi:hypothetical protein